MCAHVVTVVSPVSFKAASDEAHLAMFNAAGAEARKRLQDEDLPENVRAKLARRMRSPQVRCKLWSPFDRKLQLQGLRL
eukprot:9255375-Pyramimonas_sp.AAC.1